MADYRTALRARLIEAGTPAGDRFDWNNRPQGGAFPAGRLTTLSDQRPRHMTGINRYRPVRLQIDTMALTLPELTALTEAVLQVLWTPATVGGVRLGRAQQVIVRGDLGEQLTNGFVHRDAIDAVLWTDG